MSTGAAAKRTEDKRAPRRRQALQEAGVPVDRLQEEALRLDRTSHGSAEERADLVREVMDDLAKPRRRATTARLRDEQPQEGV